ncbi:hypothetical protein TeGR_g12852 [Tetraparma gracilis]|uniref:PX domain-containing protein n=1 Tax=Tetraparma gracilis TaxID=2962635 RepID=A0ABQ6MPB4_9STRA|nr:hypothetical protein TeGR_g12852 [Tetraparma gracilis]
MSSTPPLPTLGVNVTSLTTCPPLSPAPAENTVFYELHVSLKLAGSAAGSGVNWKVYHRYSTLLAFHSSTLLLSLPPSLKQALSDSFPPKDYLSDATDAAFLAERKEALEHYLHRVVDYVNAASDVVGSRADRVKVGGEDWDSLFSSDESGKPGGLFELLQVGGRKFRSDQDTDVEAWHYYVDGEREEVRGLHQHLENVAAQAQARKPSGPGLLPNILTAFVPTALLLLGAAAFLKKDPRELEGRVLVIALYCGLLPLMWKQARKKT